MKNKTQVVLVAGAVFCLAMLPFLRTSSYGLVNLDDYQYTVGRAQLTDAPWPAAVAWLLTSRDDAIWMPVTRLTYLLDCRVWGERPQAMHAVNVVLHGLNAVLLFLLLAAVVARGVTPASPDGPGGAPGRARRSTTPGQLIFAAAAAALFWAVHPLRVESVAWVASRKDGVSLFFELLALIVWIRRLDTEAGSLRGRRLGWTAMACFVLAGMAKPSAMTFPVLAGLLERLTSGSVVRWRDYAVPVGVACVIGIISQQTQVAGGATEVLAGVPMYGRLLNAAAAFGLYCWKTVWPTDLAVQCVHRWPELPRFWAEGLAICAGYGLALLGCGWRAGVWGLVCRRGATESNGPAENPAGIAVPPFRKSALPARDGAPYLVVFVGLAWFLMAVAPMLGLANFGLHAFADRFTYLPAVGFSVLLAVGLARAGSGGWVRWLTGGMCGVVVFFGVLADRQARYWRDERALFEHTLEVDGETNHFIRGLLGLHYYEFDHDLVKARACMDYAFANKRAKELDSFHFVYMEVLAESGDIGRAMEEAQRYLEARDRIPRPRDTELQGGAVLADGMSYLIYAVISLEEGDLATAKAHIATFDRLFPGTPHASYLMGKIALAEGDTAAAVRHWKKSLSDTRAYLRHRFIEKEIRRLEQKGLPGTATLGDVGVDRVIDLQASGKLLQ